MTRFGLVEDIVLLVAPKVGMERCAEFLLEGGDGTVKLLRLAGADPLMSRWNWSRMVSLVFSCIKTACSLNKKRQQVDAPGGVSLPYSPREDFDIRPSDSNRAAGPYIPI